ncbi:hypothetical protein D1AOALGA4SA_7937 [Olavius algarvensis Delta 1 endosymbiont]|nr:hypothetical protein D1AOALGA4SA_7937 [Olavius algarvensis Delta 1 endosymbiont]
MTPNGKFANPPGKQWSPGQWERVNIRFHNLIRAIPFMY